MFLPASSFVPTSPFINFGDFCQRPGYFPVPAYLFWPKFGSLPVYSALPLYLKFESRRNFNLGVFCTLQNFWKCHVLQFCFLVQCFKRTFDILEWTFQDGCMQPSFDKFHFLGALLYCYDSIMTLRFCERNVGKKIMLQKIK